MSVYAQNTTLNTTEKGQKRGTIGYRYVHHKAVTKNNEKPNLGDRRQSALSEQTRISR